MPIGMCDDGAVSMIKQRRSAVGHVEMNRVVSGGETRAFAGNSVDEVDVQSKDAAPIAAPTRSQPIVYLTDNFEDERRCMLICVVGRASGVGRGPDLKNQRSSSRRHMIDDSVESSGRTVRRRVTLRVPVHNIAALT